ncbi:MAG TPA: hypothetical protein VGD36_17455, partial [Xanthobacteraceae bacterium]
RLVSRKDGAAVAGCPSRPIKIVRVFQPVAAGHRGLNEAVKVALNDPEVRAHLQGLGCSRSAAGPETWPT